MHLLLVAYCFYLILVSNSFLAPSSKGLVTSSVALVLVAYCFYLILVSNSFLAPSSKALVTSSDALVTSSLLFLSSYCF